MDYNYFLISKKEKVLAVDVIRKCKGPAIIKISSAFNGTYGGRKLLSKVELLVMIKKHGAKLFSNDAAENNKNFGWSEVQL